MDDIIVDIEEEDGTTTECQVICMFEYEENAYAALVPTAEGADEAYLFGVTFEDQGEEMEFTLENIEDDKLLEELGEVFMSIMEQSADDDEDEAISSIGDELPDGITISGDTAGDPESHERIIAGNDDDSYWDQFINKKLDE